MVVGGPIQTMRFWCLANTSFLEICWPRCMYQRCWNAWTVVQEASKSNTYPAPSWRKPKMSFIKSDLCWRLAFKELVDSHLCAWPLIATDRSAWCTMLYSDKLPKMCSAKCLASSIASGPRNILLLLALHSTTWFTTTTKLFQSSGAQTRNTSWRQCLGQSALDIESWGCCLVSYLPLDDVVWCCMMLYA